jgi:CRISPR/Cas system-associated endonuclease Cas1
LHADDTNYTVVKNGVVVVSGTGPAIRVTDNKLVIRDGPKETRPLVLTRAEASRRLRHIIMTGEAGGFITFDALRWLRDTDVAFSQVDWNGSVVIASGPHGPDRPALRRAQVLICSGIAQETAVAISREILRVKLAGQAHVAKIMGRAEASAAIGGLAADIARETDGAKALAIEAKAAKLYWAEWENAPVRFARDNPQRLDHKARWRPGRAESWHTFGNRASTLTGKPWRATTPGNAILNYLFGIARTEMTVALLGAGLDIGIGLFHADRDGRPSLALDGLEAVRPYIEAWCLAFLTATAFANRDFIEMSDGEIRLGYPFSAHLAHTAALWRPPCEQVAEWLARAFAGAIDLTAVKPGPDDLPQIAPAVAEPQIVNRKLSSLPPDLLPAHVTTPAIRQLQRGLQDDPVPRTCTNCGKALPPHRRKFCNDVCTLAWHGGPPQRHSMTTIHQGRLNHTPQAENRRRSAARISRAAEATWRSRPGWSKAQDTALRTWYAATLKPALHTSRPADIRRTMDCTLPAAIEVRAGRLTPHPRHFAALAALAGVEYPW